MEELIVTQGPRTRPGVVQDALNAYQTAAWRAPGTTRFDSRPANDVRANDFLARAEAIAPRTFGAEPGEMEELPRWIVIAVAALMGALLGGMMSL